jgi:hypothetical protein
MRPSTLCVGRKGQEERVCCVDSQCQGGGRNVSRGERGRDTRQEVKSREGNYITVGFVS